MKGTNEEFTDKENGKIMREVRINKFMFMLKVLLLVSVCFFHLLRPVFHTNEI